MNGSGNLGDPADQGQVVVMEDVGDNTDAMIVNQTVQTTTIRVLSS